MPSIYALGCAGLYMRGRLSAAAFVGGAAAVQGLAALPGAAAFACAGLALAAGAAACGHLAGRRAALWLLPLAVFWLGAALATARAAVRLADELAADNENQVARVVLQVADLPQGDAQGVRFVARVLQARPAGVPGLVQVSWFAPGGHGRAGGRTARNPAGAAQALPDIVPGQVWRAALVLRRPHGSLNPHGFDYEGWTFRRGVRAMGTVRGTPKLLADRPWSDPGAALARVRHALRDGMRRALGEARYGAVLVALALGDQAGVAPGDWQVFNRTGITHLVSISGLHVTMIAALFGLAAQAGWRRASWRGRALAERTPAQVAGAAAAMAAAGLYCLLAGWGIPSQRTFFMLAVAAGAVLLRLPASPSRVLAAAAVAVVALDPWATLAPGFWLSFGAVAVLMLAGQELARPGGEAAPSAARATARSSSRRSRAWLRWREAWRFLRLATFTQLAVTAALTVPLAFMTQQVTPAAPLANALAIPVVSFVVTPLALLAAAFSALPGTEPVAALAAWAGHWAFQAMMLPIAALARAPGAVVDVAAPPWPWLVLAAAGTAWALLPRGLPWRPAGWLLLVPALCWRGDRPGPGEWRLAALDVGQGMAVVVQTAGSVLVYDTGLRYGPGSDAAARVLWPFLRGEGVRRVDTLVVSHADTDHAGGLRSLLAAAPVARSYASFDLSAHLRREARVLGLDAPVASTASAASAAPGTPGTSGTSDDEPPLPAQMRRCRAGQSWTVDGVRFAMLHPPPGARTAGRNADSCVLSVQGAYHAALLPGDIGKAQEAAIVAAGAPRADLAVLPHHGSNTSSSPALVQALGAAHVVAQAGRHNRYGHPAAAVVRRWERAGARVWRSDRDGAVLAHSGPGGLSVQAYRDEARRYWHGR